MKRNLELKAVVNEIVETGKEKDEEGRPLYPVMQEPLVITFFGAPEALFEALVERPGIVLNLIQTNKALESFWNQFHGIWITLMDALVEKELGTYASEIYPFMAIARYETGGRDKEGLLFGCAGVRNTSLYMRMAIPSEGFNLITIEGRRLRAEDPYYIVYHDPLTKLYLELLTVMGKSDVVHGFSVAGLIEKYLNYPRNIDIVYVVYLPDAFVVDAMTKDTLDFTYELREMRARVKQISYILNQFHIAVIEEGSSMVQITRHNQAALRRQWPLGTAKWLRDAMTLVEKLNNLLKDRALVLEPVVPLKLDKDTAQPYRRLLYDRQQGLYNTPEEQKQFFTTTLATISKQIGREAAIEKYGKLLLPCSVCHQEAETVDTQLMLAFCTQTCRDQYSSL